MARMGEHIGGARTGTHEHSEAAELPELSIETYADIFEHRVVEFCAPVLAGVKPAGMFSNPLVENHGRVERGHMPLARVSPGVIDEAITRSDAKLAEQGLRVVAMAHRDATTLAFVYRPDLLCAFAQREPAASMLDFDGYDVNSADACVARLAARMADFDAHPRDEVTGVDRFPHEVGIFLGYPLDDVLAFIHLRGHGVLMRGYWNVYTDVDRAKRVFGLFDESTTSCLSRYGEGEPIEDVACEDAAKARAAIRYYYEG